MNEKKYVFKFNQKKRKILGKILENQSFSEFRISNILDLPLKKKQLWLESSEKKTFDNFNTSFNIISVAMF